MNVLIANAHPNPQSLNATMRIVAANTVTEARHTVQVSDLYAMHFTPTLDESDFKDRQKPDYFDPLIEQYDAAMSRTPSLMMSLARSRRWTELTSSSSSLLCGGCLCSDSKELMRPVFATGSVSMCRCTIRCSSGLPG